MLVLNLVVLVYGAIAVFTRTNSYVWIFVVVPLMYIAAWFRFYRRSIASTREIGNPQITIQLTEKEITYSLPQATTTVEWQAVTKLWKFANLMYLFTHRQPFLLVPRTATNAEFTDFIEQQVTLAGGRVE